MDTKTFTIRVAKPKDAPLIAQIVAMAIGDELSLKDYCGEQYLKVLEEIALNEKTQYKKKRCNRISFFIIITVDRRL